MRFLALIALAAATPAFAQTDLLSLTQLDERDAAIETDAADAARAAGPFWQEGNRTFQAFGSGIVGDNDKGTIYAAHAGAGYFFADGWSFSAEAFGGRADSRVDDDGVVGGFDLMFRWHFLRDDRYTLFLGSGAGLQQADTNFPSGSHFNFRLNFLDLGGTYQLTDRAHLMGGVRYIHISNASIEQPNDGLDGAMIYTGLMFPF